MLDSEKIFCFMLKYFSEKGIIINTQTSLIQEGILDSMEIVDFILALEDYTGVEYDPESFEIRNFKTISKLISSLIIVK